MIYYNENNKFAANWLEKLMQSQLIPQGIVDRRSITEIRPHELIQYTQCHFFAGIGGWSYALELATWDINRPVWTGSCPCQPFSSAGNKKGFDDERDLWPVWFGLIKECKPPTIFGEQVEPAIKHGWLDRLSDDLEAEEYAVGSAVLPACSVGAPHQRKRLWWVANTHRYQCGGKVGGIVAGEEGEESRHREDVGELRDVGGASSQFSELANSYSQSRGCGGAHELRISGSSGGMENSVRSWQRGRSTDQSSRPSEDGKLANADSERLQGVEFCDRAERRIDQIIKVGLRSRARSWREAEYIQCTDGKFRPVEPSIRLLVDGFPSRMGLLRGFGNAIVPQVASVFIKTFMESEA